MLELWSFRSWSKYWDGLRRTVGIFFGATSIVRSEPAAGIFSDLVLYTSWKPIMLVNISGTCATTKLIQCQLFGILTCEVTRKFQQDPEAAADLFEGDFLERKRVVQSVASWCRGSKYKYVPILYDYEVCTLLLLFAMCLDHCACIDCCAVCKTFGKCLIFDLELEAPCWLSMQKDRGHLVFTDGTLTRFLLVMCFGESHPVTGSYSITTILCASDVLCICSSSSPTWHFVRRRLWSYNKGQCQPFHVIAQISSPFWTSAPLVSIR